MVCSLGCLFESGWIPHYCREGCDVLSGFWVENGAHHFRDTQSKLDYEQVKTNSVLMGAPLDRAQVDALLLHLLRRLHFRGKRDEGVFWTADSGV